MQRLLFTSLLLAAFLLSPRALVGASAITLKTNGYFFPEPAYIVLTVKIQPQRAVLVVALDCDNYYSDSQTELDEKSPTMHQYTYRSVPDGYCRALAALVVRDKVIALEQSREIVVTPSGPS